VLVAGVGAGADISDWTRFGAHRFSDFFLSLGLPVMVKW
jgi:hypothetical protein